MKLGHKLMAAASLSALLIMVVVGGSVWVLAASSKALRSQHEGSARVQTALSQAKLTLAQQHVLVYRSISLMASLSEDQVKQIRAELAREVAKVQVGVLAASRGMAQDAPVQALGAAFSGYVKAADSALDLATVDANTGVAAMQGADVQFAALRQHLDALTDQIKQVTAQAEQDTVSRSTRHEATLAVLSLVGCALAFVATWRTQRRVVSAITEVVAAANDVAKGRFDRRLASSGDDELSDLMRSLDHMVTQLSRSLLTVRQAAQSIGVASDEIATGNQDLSHRTEQTASSLQDAASSMDELTGTVRSTAQAARSANELVSSASHSAARGGEVMGQVVANMAQIDQASRRITEIISTIDGIAFQTNILALNAAVEAARAGEQGRGFAVVASEVRSLAQRSAQAAKEIKTLIATSSERVEAGSRLVHEAGASMQDIVNGVNQVNAIISEIMVAADQESQGIGMVNQTVIELDQMTQQNAALVEQSAAASDHLRQQAHRLTSTVAMFQLDESRAQ